MVVGVLGSHICFTPVRQCVVACCCLAAGRLRCWGPQAFHIAVSHAHSGSMLGSVGRWLDRGINRLIGGTSGPPSNASSDAGADGGPGPGLRAVHTAAASPATSAPSSPRVSPTACALASPEHRSGCMVCLCFHPASPPCGCKHQHTQCPLRGRSLAGMLLHPVMPPGVPCRRATTTAAPPRPTCHRRRPTAPTTMRLPVRMRRRGLPAPAGWPARCRCAACWARSAALGPSWGVGAPPRPQLLVAR